jgi:hypothetical protein
LNKVALKIAETIHVKELAFALFEVVYNWMRHEMVSYRNHSLFCPREPSPHYHCLPCHHHIIIIIIIIIVVVVVIIIIVIINTATVTSAFAFA